MGLCLSSEGGGVAVVKIGVYWLSLHDSALLVCQYGIMCTVIMRGFGVADGIDWFGG